MTRETFRHASVRRRVLITALTLQFTVKIQNHHRFMCRAQFSIEVIAVLTSYMGRAVVKLSSTNSLVEKILIHRFGDTYMTNQPGTQMADLHTIIIS